MKLSVFWLLIAPGVVLTTYTADAEVGHGAPYWFFACLCLMLLRAIRYGRMSWFYAFTAVFFVLGCWVKPSIHHLFDYPYVEPTGSFAGLDYEWAAYYGVAIALGLGLLAARLTTGMRSVRRRPFAESIAGSPVSVMQWFGLVTLATAFYALNSAAGFFITGVESKVALPFGLNAPFAFMALIGVAVVASVFLAHDLEARRKIDLTAVVAILSIAFIASLSMASRAAIVMQAMPMLIAATYVQLSKHKQGFSIGPFFLFAVFLTAALVLVSIYRITVFSSSSTNNTELLGFYALESALLVFDRWIGAEAIMVAVSEPSRSIGLTFQLLQEDAAIGNDAIYQLLAGSRYEFLQGLVFLTLPGYFGIIGLSGSLIFCFFAAWVLTALGMAYESVVSKLLFDRTICVALISAAVANALAQLSFPRLIVPFVFQMTALVLLLHFWLRPANRRSNVAPIAAMSSTNAQRTSVRSSP
jgi:hypothetical protein